MTDFRVRQLQCFLTLAEQLNYGKTARVLYMSQPTISFQIKSLEDAFNVKLFERDRKHVRLTAAGESMRHYAQSIMDLIEEAQAQLQTLSAPRSLRVACGATGRMDLLPAALRLVDKHHSTFEVEVVELTTEEQIEQLADRQIDAIMMMPELPIPDARFVPLFSAPMCALVSRQSRFATRNVISILDLQGENLLLSRREDCRFARSFLLDLLQPYGVRANLVEVPQACSMQLAYVAGGSGILLTPYSAGYNDLPDIVAVSIMEPLPSLELGYIVLQEDRRESLVIFEEALKHCVSRPSFAAGSQPVMAPGRPFTVASTIKLQNAM
jgi:DNA-binding transcriptional LysR family regulator